MGDPGRHSVLLAGSSRSGSTWISRALAQGPGTTLVHEPDNDRLHSAAVAAKATLGSFPVLDGGDEAPALQRLYEAALRGDGTAGARRRRWADRVFRSAEPAEITRAMEEDPTWSPRLRLARHLTTVPRPEPQPGTRVVKSVHCAFCLEWIAERVRPDAVGITLRHPAGVIGSWRSMGWGLRLFPWHDRDLWDRFGPAAGDRPSPVPPEDHLERAAWYFALTANALLLGAERHGWTVIDHEDLLWEPVDALARVAGALGLQWTDEAAQWVRDTDKPGEGYELTRVLSEERDEWKRRLDAREAAVVRRVLDTLPLLADRWEWSTEVA